MARRLPLLLLATLLLHPELALGQRGLRGPRVGRLLPASQGPSPRVVVGRSDHTAPPSRVAAPSPANTAPPLVGPLPPSEAPRIVNGLLTSSFPAVGALFFGSSFACTGTMIGCSTFLTAAHCVCPAGSGFTGPDCQPGEAGEPDAGNYTVFLQHAGFHSVSDVAVHPQYRVAFDFDADVAVLTLTSPVDGISPRELNVIGDPGIGAAGTIVGFGQTAGANLDAGMKRLGDLQMADCGTAARNTSQICSSFLGGGAPGADSNTCNGDSGGPLFWRRPSGSLVVAGLTSAGNASCLPVDLASFADVAFEQSFIQGVAGADLANTTCGSTPQVGHDGSSILAAVDTLSAGTTTRTYSLAVPAGATSLRVAMNGDSDSDFDLLVNHGSAPASPGAWDCVPSNGTSFEYCEFAVPAPGMWFVRSSRSSGTGLFQLTATTLAPPTGADFQPRTSCRAIDTREPNGPYGGPRLAAGPDRVFPLTTVCGVPASAKAISATLFAIDPSTGGFITLYPGGDDRPLTAAASFGPGAVVANNIMVAVSDDGTASLATHVPAGDLDFVLEINGWFE